MKYLHKLVLLAAFGAAFFMAVAQAQNAGTVTNHAIPLGKGPGVQGMGSLVLGNGQIPIGQTGADPQAIAPTGDVTINSAGVTAIGANKVTNPQVNPGAANTFKGSLNGTATSDIAITACNVVYQVTQWISGSGWTCGFIPVLPSRAVAATLNLSAFNAVQTLGYNLPGDGGEALFQKNNGAITSLSITTAGAGCTNTVTSGIYFTGGSGRKAQGTATVSGGVVTNMALSGTGGRGIGFTVGNVLTAVNVPGCTTQPTFTITAIENAPFIDSQVNNVSIAGTGTGCTNGTYYGEVPIGGNGAQIQGNATISGGVLTTFSVTGTGGGGYRVGDTLNFTSSSPAIPGCVGQPAISVAGVTTPLGSFTDAGSNGWQIAYPKEGLSIRQFGAVQNYIRAIGDASATDDGPAIQAALRFAAIGSWFQDAGGYGGNQVIVPPGASLVCNGLTVPAFVTLRALTRGSGVLKQCESDNLAWNFISLGDPANHQNAFDANLENLTLFGGGGTSGTGYMVYSNNSQSANSLNNVSIYSVARGCLKYEIGYGGPSGFGVHGGICIPNNGLTPSPAISLSGNFTFTFDNDWHLSVGGSQWPGIGILLGGGGTFQMFGGHCENLVICISYDGSGSSPMLLHIANNTGQAAVSRYVSIKTGSLANAVNMQNFGANGTVCNVYKEATSTCASTGNILGSVNF